MTTYGYIRTSRDQEPGHPGSDPHVQRRQLVGAGVEPAQVYADVAASGAKDYNSRDQWHVPLGRFRMIGFVNANQQSFHLSTGCAIVSPDAS